MAMQETNSAGDSAEIQYAAQRRKRRPLSKGQEILFFGITFAVAALLQLAVVFDLADLLTW